MEISWHCVCIGLVSSWTTGRVCPLPPCKSGWFRQRCPPTSCFPQPPLRLPRHFVAALAAEGSVPGNTGRDLSNRPRRASSCLGKKIPPPYDRRNSEPGTWSTRQDYLLVSPVSGLIVSGLIEGTSATAVAKSPSWLMLISHSCPSSVLTSKASPFRETSDSLMSCPLTSCKAS